MKKACALSLALFLLAAGNCFAVTFAQIELLSKSFAGGHWSLDTDIFLNNAISPDVTYYVDNDGPYQMPLTSVFGGAFTFYLDDISAKYPGNIPSDFNGATFTWVVTDTTNNLYATGVPSGICDLPLSTDLIVTGDPYQPTVFWFNPASDLLDAYRIRLFNPSYTLLGQWDISVAPNPTFTFPSTVTLLPGQDYIIRVEARKYLPFDLFDADGKDLDFHGIVTNRSNAELHYTVPVPEPALLLIGTATYEGQEYNLIYEDDQNLVWLDYTKGADTWQNQVNWASGLGGNLTVILNPGYTTIDWSTGWRLPIVDESKANLSGGFGWWGPDQSGYHTYLYGYNMVNSEMGHLYFESLENKGWTATDGTHPQPGWGLQNTSPFINLQPDVYWLGTEFASDPNAAWIFQDSYQGGQGKNDGLYYALAVRSGKVIVLSANQPPVAQPGNHQSVKHGSQVTLDASESYDPDGNYPLIYHWEILSKPAGSSAQISYPHSPNPTFVPDLPGGYRVQLIVEDSLGLPSKPSDSQQIIFQPGPLDGMDVWITYPYYDFGKDTWYLIVGGWGNEYYSLIKFDIEALPEAISSAQIQLHCFGESGLLVPMRLDRLNSFWDETTKWQNRPSYTHLASLPTPVVGQWYSIDITPSYNDWKSGTYVNYGIQLRPTFYLGSDHINNFFSSDYLDEPSFRPKLTVQYSGHPQVLISAYNTPPIAHAGPDQFIIEIGTLVYLDGTHSWDDDGDPITYSWNFTEKPANSSASLDFPWSATPSFTADVHGEYRVSLVVSDAWATSAPDEVVISFQNIAPVANAGGNQSLVLGETAYLDGSGSYDANLDPLSYSWSFITRPDESLAEMTNPFSVHAYFEPDVAGEYIVTLLVDDGFVKSEPSSVLILVITKQEAINEDLQETIEIINSTPPENMLNPNNAKALTNKLNTALQLIEDGLYEEALDKLQNDILAKTNGCAEIGQPDRNDWIKDCESQSLLYPVILDAINLLNSLL